MANTASELFTLRQARESDRALLNAYNAAEGMDALPDVEGVTVAADTNDTAVGFIRIARGNNGIAHVNPVVVYAPWRGYGVGSELVRHALACEGELRLVARGSSVGFYEKLGFEQVPWEAIDQTVTEDCLHCPMSDECAPLPMKIVS